MSLEPLDVQWSHHRNGETLGPLAWAEAVLCLGDTSTAMPISKRLLLNHHYAIEINKATHSLERSTTITRYRVNSIPCRIEVRDMIGLHCVVLRSFVGLETC